MHPITVWLMVVTLGLGSFAIWKAAGFVRREWWWLWWKFSQCVRVLVAVLVWLVRLKTPEHKGRQSRLAELKHQFEELTRSLDDAGMDPLELRTAKEKAKQKYLRKVDEELR